MNAVVAVSGYDLPVQCSMIKKRNNYLKPLFPKDFWKTSSNLKVFCDIGSFVRKLLSTKITSPFYIEKREQLILII